MAFLQPSLGYDGTVSETGIAKMAHNFGADYAVEGPNDWKVTTVAGQDRTIQIAPGTGYGHFVRDTTNSIATLQFATVASGTRWDLVVCRRDWQPPGGTTTFEKVQGTSTKAIPSGRLVGPGIRDDQPLALVQLTAGQTLPTAIVDLRTWPSKVITANDLLALPSAPHGTEAVVGTVRYRRILDDTGNLAWVEASGYDTGWVAAGLTNKSGFKNTTSRTRILNGVVQLDLRVDRTGAAITPGNGGGITDLAILGSRGDCAPSGRSVYTGGAYTTTGTFGCDLRLDTDGTVTLMALTPGASLTTGASIFGTFTYLL